MRVAWSAIAIGLVSSSPALADAGADDVATLLKQLEDEHAALSTSDCSAACRALGSIRRAADKICALEPGPRCDTARTKAEDATRRVREACPDCVIPCTQPVPERAAKPAPEAHRVLTSDESAPRGGCRSCASVPGGSRADLGLIVLGVLGLARVFGARRSRARTRR